MLDKPTKTWYNVFENTPKDKQMVWYWFGLWDIIFSGFYNEGDEFCFHYFHSNHGYLGDDITWWAEREEGELEPNPPIDEQKKKCKYFPK